METKVNLKMNQCKPSPKMTYHQEYCPYSGCSVSLCRHLHPSLAYFPLSLVPVATTKFSIWAWEAFWPKPTTSQVTLNLLLKSQKTNLLNPRTVYSALGPEFCYFFFHKPPYSRVRHLHFWSKGINGQFTSCCRPLISSTVLTQTWLYRLCHMSSVL